MVDSNVDYITFVVNELKQTNCGLLIVKHTTGALFAVSYLTVRNM